MVDEDLKKLIEELTPAAFQAFYTWVLTVEQPRREALPKLEATKVEVIRQLRSEGLIETPPIVVDDPTDFPVWHDPGTVHAKMYLLGDRVLHDDRVWESIHPGLNHWEPGAVGVDERIWKDMTEDLFPPVFDIPPVEVEVEVEGEPDELPQEATIGISPIVRQKDLEFFTAGESTPPDWRPSQAYKAGDKVKFNDATYTVSQPHTSLPGWEPPKVPALWKKV